MIIKKYLVSLKKKKKYIKGRGDTTAGRGTKGQKSRKSGHVRSGFEGGQTPVYLRFPKRGFKKKIKKYKITNLEKINKIVLDSSKKEINFFKIYKFPVKILANGDLKKKEITIFASFFSKEAKKKIINSGGNAKTSI